MSERPQLLPIGICCSIHAEPRSLKLPPASAGAPLGGPEPGLFGAAWCISHGSSAWGLSLAWQRLSQLCCHLRLFFLFLSPFTSVRPVSVCRLSLPTSASLSSCILCGLSKYKPRDWFYLGICITEDPSGCTGWQLPWLMPRRDEK